MYIRSKSRRCLDGTPSRLAWALASSKRSRGRPNVNRAVVFYIVTTSHRCNCGKTCHAQLHHRGTGASITETRRKMTNSSPIPLVVQSNDFIWPPVSSVSVPFVCTSTFLNVPVITARNNTVFCVFPFEGGVYFWMRLKFEDALDSP